MPVEFFTLAAGMFFRLAFAPAHELLTSSDARKFHFRSAAYARRKAATPSFIAAATSFGETDTP